jgi:hypothetical protein
MLLTKELTFEGEGKKTLPSEEHDIAVEPREFHVSQSAQASALNLISAADKVYFLLRRVPNEDILCYYKFTEHKSSQFLSKCTVS